MPFHPSLRDKNSADLELCQLPYKERGNNNCMIGIQVPIF